MDTDHNSSIACQHWGSVVSDLADQVQICSGFTIGHDKANFWGCIAIKAWALKV